ncbi:YceI family protein [Lutibacter sp.]
MKKLHLIGLLLLTMITISSCKQKEKKVTKPSKKGYTVEPTATTINWVAYKTTSKIPVKGQFTKVTIEHKNKATTVIKALNNLKFSIPVNSLFTKDTIRDKKLKKFFFGTMENTTEIEGVITIINQNYGTVSLTMNKITQELPISYTVNNQIVNIEAIIDLDNWKAQLALKALNAACNDLHSGDDGISKTWSEVKIKVSTLLKYE